MRGAGWVTQQPNDAAPVARGRTGDVYKTYFGYSDRLRFIFREAPAVRRTGGGGIEHASRARFARRA